MTIRASVIIPTFGRRYEEISPALVSLFSQLPADCEMIIVDQNDEVDVDLARFASRDTARLRHVRISEKGLPNARNVGTADARGEILIFCDDDIFALAGFVDAHLACYRDPSVGGVAGRVVSGVYADSSRSAGGSAGNEATTRSVGRDTISSCARRSAPSLREGEMASRPTIGRFRWWDADFRANFDATSSCEVDSTFGCNMSFRKALVGEVGGFSKSFGGTAHLEESDLCLRLRGRGAKLIFEPAACLVHIKGAAGGCRAGSTRRWVYWYGHNYMLFFLRHFRVMFLPVFLVERLARLVGFLAESGDLLLMVQGMKGLVDGAHTYVFQQGALGSTHS